jgi:hypothetical protein
MGYWHVHGLFFGFFFISFLLVLPRVTMLASLALPIGMGVWITAPLGLENHPLGALVIILGWTVWVILPRFLIAIIATALYWSTNPLLCLGAWAIGWYVFRSKKQAARENARKRRGTPGRQHAQPRSATQQVKEWWDVLGVNPWDSADTVKAAYRSIAKATHPDSAPDHKGDADRFRRANEAYRKATKRDGI